MRKGKAKTQFKRAMVSLLTAALVASGSFGLTTITSSASVADVDLSDPLKFSVYTNVYTNSNHVEGNVAIGNLQASLDIWEGKSYIGDLANSNASFRCNIRDSIVAFAANNSDGTANIIADQPGQGYKLTVVSRGTGEEAEDVVVREFITDNKMIGYECRTDIASRISTVINACKNTSRELYALEDVETDNLLVLNISAADFNSQGEYYDKLITESASAGKTVVVNVADSGSVTLSSNMNATTVGGGLGYQSWAGNIVWNFGNASSVTTGGMFGTILAPSASVTNNANIVGAVIANSFAQGGEVHQVNYTRGIPTPPPTPTPTPEVPEETPTPTPEVPEETPTPTPEVPEETPTPTPEVTPTPTPEVTPTPTPEVTPTPTPEVTPTPTPEETPTPTPEVTPTPTPEVTPTPTPVVTPTPTPAVTPTPTPEVTPTPTPEVTPTPTPEVTPTPTPETTPTPTPTPPVSTPTPPTPPVTTTPTPTPPVEETPTPTPSVPTPPPSEPPTPPEVQGVRRFVVIEDEDTPLADAAVLGADRRPQTGDASDVWTIAFLASISGLAAWVLQGKKK